MLKKLQNKKGFTLMEMLIVVAIIAVLVAIAIPTFSGALTKSKEAADVANIRAAYAEWQIKILNDNDPVPQNEADFIGSTKLNYNKTTTNTAAATGDNLFVSYDGTKDIATITYKSSKLTDGNGADANTYVWTLNPLDIK